MAEQHDTSGEQPRTIKLAQPKSERSNQLASPDPSGVERPTQQPPADRSERRRAGTRKKQKEEPREPREGGGSYRKLLTELAENADKVRAASEEVSVLSNVHQLVGKTIDGKYEVLQKLGQGGMGCVFKARHKLLDRFLAIKVLNPSLSNDEDSLERFLREAKTVSSIKHPNAISLYEFGIDGNLPYLVMEFVEGKNLGDIIRDEAPLRLGRTYALLKQVSDALSYAHGLGVIHRDLKPENIMITEGIEGTEFAQVLDFGMAKMMNPDGPVATKLSTTGVPCGTPHYMSPEQVVAKTVDNRCDVYALGIIAYEMLSGQTPFEQYSLVEILFHQLHTVPPFITELKPELKVPASIEDVIARALEKDPDHRHQSVQEFIEDFHDHLGDTYVPRRRKLTLAQITSKFEPQVTRWFERGWYERPWTHAARNTTLIILGIAFVWACVRYRVTLGMYATAPVLYLEHQTGIDLSIVKSVTRYKVDWSDEELFDNIRKGKVLMLEAQLLAGMDPNIKDAKGASALHRAVESHLSGAFSLLLEHGADPTVKDLKGVTPMMLAAVRNKASMVYDLAEKGGLVDADDREGRTALIHALRSNAISAVHALINLNAAINKVDAEGTTPLIYAVRHTDGETVLLLLDKGALINARNKQHQTALMAAAARGSAEMITLLINRGADSGMIDIKGKTALMYAVAAGQHSAVETLLRLGARADVRDTRGRTALDIAVSKRFTNVELLLKQHLGSSKNGVFR